MAPAEVSKPKCPLRPRVGSQPQLYQFVRFSSATRRTSIFAVAIATLLRGAAKVSTGIGIGGGLSWRFRRVARRANVRADLYGQRKNAYRMMATTRAGAAEAPTMRKGKTATSKPWGGSAPRLMSCSMCQ